MNAVRFVFILPNHVKVLLDFTFLWWKSCSLSLLTSLRYKLRTAPARCRCAQKPQAASCEREAGSELAACSLSVWHHFPKHLPLEVCPYMEKCSLSPPDWRGYPVSASLLLAVCVRKCVCDRQGDREGSGGQWGGRKAYLTRQRPGPPLDSSTGAAAASPLTFLCWLTWSWVCLPKVEDPSLQLKYWHTVKILQYTVLHVALQSHI